MTASENSCPRAFEQLTVGTDRNQDSAVYTGVVPSGSNAVSEWPSLCVCVCVFVWFSPTIEVFVADLTDQSFTRAQSRMNWKCVSVCACACLCSGLVVMLSGPRSFISSVWGLRSGFRVEVQTRFRLGSGLWLWCQWPCPGSSRRSRSVVVWSDCESVTTSFCSCVSRLFVYLQSFVLVSLCHYYTSLITFDKIMSVKRVIRALIHEQTIVEFQWTCWTGLWTLDSGLVFVAGWVLHFLLHDL